MTLLLLEPEMYPQPLTVRLLDSDRFWKEVAAFRLPPAMVSVAEPVGT